MNGSILAPQTPVASLRNVIDSIFVPETWSLVQSRWGRDLEVTHLLVLEQVSVLFIVRLFTKYLLCARHWSDRPWRFREPGK
jgi:hypothetical protein